MRVRFRAGDRAYFSLWEWCVEGVIEQDGEVVLRLRREGAEDVAVEARRVARAPSRN